jgi:hypothetical protein
LRSKTGFTILLPLLALLLALGVGASPASAQSGGTAGPTDPSAPAPTTPAPGTAPATVPGTRAKLTKSGLAIPPADAPQAVIDAINAGNRIRKKPYIYGGGHASFKAKGYDCSGAVSYVLNAAGLLDSPIPSGPLMKWGIPGKGSWITVYSNPGHAYAVIAGLRWDTSAMGSGGNGPRWRATKRPAKGFAARTYLGF